MRKINVRRLDHQGVCRALVDVVEKKTSVYKECYRQLRP